MKINANFTYNSIPFDQEKELHMVVSLTAPKKDWETERSPICVLPVIDVSGSMTGNKINYAKKSASKLLDHLTSQDYSGLVVFDSSAKVISKVIPMTSENKAILRQKIEGLRPGSSTNFCGGLMAGLSEIKDADLPNNINLRMIMLTDGHANVGSAITEDAIKNVLIENRGRATVSCFGYGEGANQDSLAAFANAGNANYAFIQNPDDALTAFAKELGGLLSTYAQNIKLNVKAEDGHVLSDVISNVDMTGDENEININLPEILGEETRNLVFKTKIVSQPAFSCVQIAPFVINVTYDVVQKDGSVNSVSQKIDANINLVKSGSKVQVDKDLDKIVALAEMIKAQVEAESMAKAGRYQDAARIMQNTSELFTERDLLSYANQASKLGSKMENQSIYYTSSSYLNTSRGMGRGVAVSSMHADVMNDIADLGIVASTSTQESLQASFTSDESDENADTVKD